MESIPNHSETNVESVAPLLDNGDGSTLSGARIFEARQTLVKKGAEVQRGKIIASICLVFVILAWILVMTLAIEDLAQSKNRL